MEADEVNQVRRAGSWLDRLIPKSLRAEPGSLYRSRLFILLFSFIVGIGLAAFLGINSLRSELIPVAFNPTAILACLFLYGLTLYSFYGVNSLVWAVNSLMLAVTVAVFSIALALVLKYNMLTFMLLPVPVMAFILGGRWSGSAWTLVMGGLQMVVNHVYFADYGLSLALGDVDISKGETFSMVVHGLVIFMVVISCLTYEFIVSKLQLDLEKDKVHFVHLANHDSLTGLPNRLAFETYVRKLMVKSLADNEVFALVYIDLDNFKRVNDSYGHYAGDVVLKELAGRMLDLVRNGDYVCRLGGDEFSIVLPKLGDSELVNKRIEGLRRSLQAVIMINGEAYHPGASFGHALFPTDADDFEELLRRADVAMYQSKRDPVSPNLENSIGAT